MGRFEKELMNFIDDTPNAYYCVANIKKILDRDGYKELKENESWEKVANGGKYYVIRNDSSLIAFNAGDLCNTPDRFNIVAVHGDSPAFTVKRNPDMYDGMYLKLNTQSYGGMINYTWFDRPLSLAGRVILKKDGVLSKNLINIDKDLLVIPSQAVHVNRGVNESATFNRQNDMIPVMSLVNSRDLNEVIREQLVKEEITPDKIYDYDLYVYNRDKAREIGLNKEMIMAPRLDDLGSVYPALEAFETSEFEEPRNKDSISVLCVFNNEEIGSLTEQGADSSFLKDVLSRIAQEKYFDINEALADSFMISADNAHATHPNAIGKSDPTNKVELNKGVVIKHHTNYTTDALSSAVFKALCEEAKVPYQDFECRSDMPCGATLGGISTSHVSIDSVDIGLPQLAMHSANETMGSKDALDMYKSLYEFYTSKIEKEDNKIKILKG